MERVQEMEFVDLAKPRAKEETPREPKAMSRRQFLAAAGGVAAVTAMAKTRIIKTLGVMLLMSMSSRCRLNTFFILASE